VTVGFLRFYAGGGGGCPAWMHANQSGRAQSRPGRQIALRIASVMPESRYPKAQRTRFAPYAQRTPESWPDPARVQCSAGAVRSLPTGLRPIQASLVPPRRKSGLRTLCQRRSKMPVRRRLGVQLCPSGACVGTACPCAIVQIGANHRGLSLQRRPPRRATSAGTLASGYGQSRRHQLQAAWL